MSCKGKTCTVQHRNRDCRGGQRQEEMELEELRTIRDALKEERDRLSANYDALLDDLLRMKSGWETALDRLDAVEAERDAALADAQIAHKGVICDSHDTDVCGGGCWVCATLSSHPDREKLISTLRGMVDKANADISTLLRGIRDLERRLGKERTRAENWKVAAEALEVVYMGDQLGNKLPVMDFARELEGES